MLAFYWKIIDSEINNSIKNLVHETKKKIIAVVLGYHLHYSGLLLPHIIIHQ